VQIASHYNNVNFNQFCVLIAINFVVLFLELSYCMLLHDKFGLLNTGKRKVIYNFTVLQYLSDADIYK